ncbi:hypothetical protein T265_05873 [Opisthorchis viverrini]|uniref:Uncharacterized protein n=1 Tax=Opisthorchis viverrini TaxID=6198 RepID=A0A075AEQ7_OPIVI|nr:hypothetical protein T265_05873 [Opisthorchis viverrini]KER26964.1 hypothetical protein T265_05873 [Opisthorchis viverrini]
MELKFRLPRRVPDGLEETVYDYLQHDAGFEGSANLVVLRVELEVENDFISQDTKRSVGSER